MSEITIEELQKQLEESAKQLEESNKQITNLKATLSERNSEAAKKKREMEEWKSRYESTLSEQEKAEAERKAAEEARDRELAELKRDSTINKYKAKYLSMGYSEELAQSSAEARVDGNDDVLFQNESKFAEQTREDAKTELLKTQPGLSRGKSLSEEEAQKIRDEKLYKYAGL